MVAGELQLGLNFEAQDIYFTFRPKFSYYVAVFRRYEKFVIETKSIESDNNSISNDTDTIISFTIPRNDGDLLKSMYLQVELPDIYSGIMFITGDYNSSRNMAQDFRWIRELGTYLIKNAKLKIGDNVIQELHDEYRDVWKELHLSDDEKSKYNSLTGNTDEMNFPYYVNGNESMGDIVVTGPHTNPTFIVNELSNPHIVNAFTNTGVVFVPNQSQYFYNKITGVPVAMTSFLQPNDEISFDGQTFNFYNTSYSSMFANIGNITFDTSDTTDVSTLTGHLSKKRITVYGNPNYSIILMGKQGSNVSVQYYNKYYNVPLLFNFTNKTFERADGGNHGLSNDEQLSIAFNGMGTTTFSFTAMSNNISNHIAASYSYDTITNVTATTFQLKDPNTTLIYDGGIGNPTDGKQQWTNNLGIKYMYNPLTKFWKREDGADHGYDNEDEFSFNAFGDGFNDVFGSGTFYVRNKTDKELQLSSSVDGNILYSQNMATIMRYDPKFQYVTLDNRWSRVDGLNHGFFEGEGIIFQMKPLGAGIKLVDNASNKTLIVKNITDTTFQIYAYDRSTGTEKILAGDTNDNSGDWEIAIAGFQVSHHLNNSLVSPSNIELWTTYSIGIIKTIHPMGLSSGTGSSENFRHTLFYRSSDTDTDLLKRKLISKTTHYPFAKELRDDNLLNSEIDYVNLGIKTGNDVDKTLQLKIENNIIDNFNDTITETTLPSIQGKTLKIPLYFYFQKDITKALPLIALQQTQVKLELTLRPIRDLYVSKFTPLLELDDALFSKLPFEITEALGCDIKENDGYFKTSGIQYFLAGNNLSPNTEIFGSGGTKELTSFDINPRLEYNVIYLSDNQRRHFFDSKRQYYIERPRLIKRTSEKNNQVTSINIKLKGNRPLKEIIFVPKRSDAKDLNQWDNFTNNILLGTNMDSVTYSKQYLRPVENYYRRAPQYVFNTRTTNFPFPYTQITENKAYNKDTIKKDIIKNIEIGFTNDPFTRKILNKPGNYYQHQQVSEYYKNNIKDGIYLYSFSLDPRKVYPTGAKMKDISNLITLHDLNINIEFNDLPDKDLYDAGYDGTNFYSEKKLVSAHNFDVNIYMVEYDILEINNGVGTLLFS